MEGKESVFKVSSWICTKIFVIQFISLFLLAGFFIDPAYAQNKTEYIAPSYKFKFTSNQWLTMPDGVKLSASYWIPVAKTKGERFPVVLEVLPYRKDDSHFTEDYPVLAYLASRGIACARVDIRGTGSSFGVTPDREYSDAELNDLQVIIDKVASQPWSNGNIGMQGISWSAFNSIMAAMRQPPHLKGILVAHGSDDLYGNDIHNIDGALHLDIFTIEIETDNLLPRSPDYTIDQQYWSDRFEQKPWVINYLQHQRDSNFWQNNRSLQSDFSAIKVPVYALAGLLDGYRDYAIQMLEHLQAPLKVTIGPQSHAWPDGEPGPGYEWRQNAVRWWLQVLNNKNTGIWNEPKLTVFMRGSVPADVNLKTTPGVFRTENWPVPARSVKYTLQNDHSLADQNSQPDVHALVYKPSAGMGVLNWWGETTPDMREADKDTLLYDSKSLTENLYILGNPRVKLSVSANVPLAHWVVRLEDVNPDGTVAFVTGGLINGAQRNSRFNPKDIPVDKQIQLDIPMHFTTWTFAKGHKIRLSVTNTQFPMIWPTPDKMTAKLYVGKRLSELSLPSVAEKQSNISWHMPVDKDAPVPGAIDLKRIVLDPFSVWKDGKGNTFATAREGYMGWIHGEIYFSHYKVTYKVNDDHPEDASFIGEGEDSIQNFNHRLIKVASTIYVDSDKKYFHVKVVRKLAMNGKAIKTKTWKEDILRDFE